MKFRWNSCEFTRIRTKFVQKTCEFRANSYEFMPMDRLQACRFCHFWFWAPFGHGGCFLGLHFHWMMRNEAGDAFYHLKSLRSNQKYGVFLRKSRNLGKLSRVLIPHSYGHLSPIRMYMYIHDTTIDCMTWLKYAKGEREGLGASIPRHMPQISADILDPNATNIRIVPKLHISPYIPCHRHGYRLATESTKHGLHEKYHTMILQPTYCKVTPTRTQVTHDVRTGVTNRCTHPPPPPPLGVGSAFMPTVT